MDRHSTGYRLVFVHGAGCDAACWGAQTEFFKDAEALTLPGHYADEFEAKEGRKTVEEYASWLHDWVVSEHTVEHKPGKVVLVGHSMGGAIALIYALTYPEDLAGLVLAGTGARLRVNHQILDLLQKDFAAAVDFLVPNFYTANAPDEMRQESREALFRVGQDITLGDFLACNNYDVTDELGRLKSIPTLIVTGAADVMTPPKLANFLAENIAGAKLEFIDACGHMLQAEKAHEFNRIIDEFLANLPPVEEEETESTTDEHR